MAPQLEFVNVTNCTHTPFTARLSSYSQSTKWMSVCAPSCHGFEHCLLAEINPYLSTILDILYLTEQKLNHLFCFATLTSVFEKQNKVVLFNDMSKFCFGFGIEGRAKKSKTYFKKKRKAEIPQTIFFLPHHCQDCLTWAPSCGWSLLYFPLCFLTRN